MERSEIEKFIDVAMRSIAPIWAEGKDSAAIMHLLSGPKSTGTMIVVPSFANDYEKDVFADTMRALIKRDEPRGVIFFDEAWMNYYSVEEANKMLQGNFPRPHVRPDRIEVWIWNLEMRDGFKENRTYEILRDGKRKYIERANFLANKGLKTTGRFTNWFAP